MPAEDDDLPGDSTPEPTTKKKPTEPVEERAAPRKHQHTQRLVSIATELGFSQADLDNHPSETIWEEVHRIQTLQAEQSKAKQLALEKPKTPVEEVDEDEAYIAELEKDPEVSPKFAKLLRKLKAGSDNKEVKEKLDKLDAIEA